MLRPKVASSKSCFVQKLLCLKVASSKRCFIQNLLRPKVASSKTSFAVSISCLVQKLLHLNVALSKSCLVQKLLYPKVTLFKSCFIQKLLHPGSLNQAREVSQVFTQSGGPGGWWVGVWVGCGWVGRSRPILQPTLAQSSQSVGAGCGKKTDIFLIFFFMVSLTGIN